MSTYTVGNRRAYPFAKWGFTLPQPRPALPLPPLNLPGGSQGLAEVMMGETIIGSYANKGVIDLHMEKESPFYYRDTKPLPPSARGIWTSGISDCQVVCGAYYDSNLSSWQRVWFQHVPGGLTDDIVFSIGYDINDDGEAPDVLCRYAVIACGRAADATDVTAGLIGVGIPARNISVYISSSGRSGFAFGVNFSTGLFGELSSMGAEITTHNLPSRDV